MKLKYKYLWALLLVPTIIVTPLVIVACANTPVATPNPTPPVTPPDTPGGGSLTELKKPGQKNNIHYDKYFEVLATLNLQNDSQFQLLNDEIVNQTIAMANPDFKDIKISIKSGERLQGRLVFNISGSYKNITIPSEEIIVSGFYTKLADYNVVEQMTIIDFEMNLIAYFNELQTKSLESQWDAVKFFHYVNSVEAWRASQPNPIRADLKKLFDDNIVNAKLENFSDFVNNTNPTKAKLIISFINHFYNNGIWEEKANSETVEIFFTKDVTKKLPNLSDALKFAIDHQTIVVNNAPNNYASAIYSQLTQDEEGFVANHFVEIKPTYFNTYFSDISTDDNYLLIKGDIDTTVANDLEGILNLGVYFSLPVSNNIVQHLQTYKIEGFLKLIDYLNDNNSPDNNLIHISNNSTTMRKRIVESIKTEFNQSALDNLEQNKEYTMIDDPVYFRPKTIDYSLYNSERGIDDKLDKQLLTNGTFSFLNATFNESSINASTNLYRIRGANRNSFYINHLGINFDETNKPTITKTNNNLYFYRVKFKYSLHVQDDIYKIDTYYICNLLASDLA